MTLRQGGVFRLRNPLPPKRHEHEQERGIGPGRHRQQARHATPRTGSRDRLHLPRHALESQHGAAVLLTTNRPVAIRWSRPSTEPAPAPESIRQCHCIAATTRPGCARYRRASPSRTTREMRSDRAILFRRLPEYYDCGQAVISPLCPPPARIDLRQADSRRDGRQPVLIDQACGNQCVDDTQAVMTSHGSRRVSVIRALTQAEASICVWTLHISVQLRDWSARHGTAPIPAQRLSGARGASSSAPTSTPHRAVSWSRGRAAGAAPSRRYTRR